MKELVIRAIETKLSIRYCVLRYLVSFTWPCHTVYHEAAKLASNPVNVKSIFKLFH